MLKQLKIWNIIMVILTAIIFAVAVIFIVSGNLPFGMQIKKGADPAFMTAGLLIFGALALAETIFGFLTVKDSRKGSICNVISYIFLAVAVIVFITCIGDDAVDWILYFLFTVPTIAHSAFAQKVGKGK